MNEGDETLMNYEQTQVVSGNNSNLAFLCYIWLSFIFRSTQREAFTNNLMLPLGLSQVSAGISGRTTFQLKSFRSFFMIRR
jgi:hypothetical protein